MLATLTPARASMLHKSREVCCNRRVLKTKAIELLGGSPRDAAEAVGVSQSAVSQWPDRLPPRISDRVLAALARKHLPPGLIGQEPVQQMEPTHAG